MPPPGWVAWRGQSLWGALEAGYDEREGDFCRMSTCALMFAVGLPAFCVDTHIQRICARLGLIGTRDSAEKAQHLLEATVPPEDTYALHVAMIRHGRQVCRAQRPRCTGCPLFEFCLYGNSSV